MPDPTWRRRPLAAAWWLLATALLAGAALAGCRAAATSTPSEALRTRRGDLVDRVVLTGEVQATEGDVLTVPPCPDWQTQIRRLEDDGVEVAAGQVIAELDTVAAVRELSDTTVEEEAQASELATARARVEADRRDKELALAEAHARLDKAELGVDLPEEITSARARAEAALEVERARAAVAKAEKDLAAAGRGSEEERAALAAKLEAIRRRRARASEAIGALTLRAPRDGVLQIADHPWEGRRLAIGDTVWVGMPVARIPDLHRLEVIARLDDVDDGRVAPGVAGVCRPDAFLDVAAPCHVVAVPRIAQEVGAKSQRRAFRVRVALDGEGAARDRLRPGMSVRVELARRLVSGVVVAPRAALDVAGTPPHATRADGSRVEIALGACTADECAVTSGLGADEPLARAAPQLSAGEPGGAR